MKELMKHFLVWILIFLSVYIVGSICFVGLFHTPVMDHMKVLMYRGIVLLIVSGILVAILLLLIRKCLYQRIEGKDIFIMVLMFCCVNMVLFTLIPVTVERSVSVFMLSYMSDHKEEAFTEEEIEKVFIQSYVEEFGAFEKRFFEQEITGTISEDKGNYYITKKGEKLVELFRFVGKIFGTDERLLHSE